MDVSTSTSVLCFSVFLAFLLSDLLVSRAAVLAAAAAAAGAAAAAAAGTTVL